MLNISNICGNSTLETIRWESIETAFIFQHELFPLDSKSSTFITFYSAWLFEFIEQSTPMDRNATYSSYVHSRPSTRWKSDSRRWFSLWNSREKRLISTEIWIFLLDRQHSVDCLPRVWMFDGIFVSSKNSSRLILNSNRFVSFL